MGKKINMNQGEITFPTASSKFLTVICRARDASSTEACVFHACCTAGREDSGSERQRLSTVVLHVRLPVSSRFLTHHLIDNQEYIKLYLLKD